MTGFRDSLRSDRALVGTVISSPDPALAESAATAFDFLWIDLEHGALDIRDVQELAIAIQGRGCAAVVRLPHWRAERLPAILDAGVDGVVAPMIETAAEAGAVVDRLRYPPRGHRGFGPRRAGAHGGRPACMVQIETPRGVGNAAEVARVDGVDALIAGTADLAMAQGTPDEIDTEAMREALDEVGHCARGAGVAFGLAGGGEPTRLVDLGGAEARVYVYSVDVRLYAAAVTGAAQQVAEAIRGGVDRPAAAPGPSGR